MSLDLPAGRYALRLYSPVEGTFSRSVLLQGQRDAEIDLAPFQQNVALRINGNMNYILALSNERRVWPLARREFRQTSRIVARLRREYQIKPRYDRLRAKGLLTLEEMSARLDIGPKCVITWRNHGLLHGYPVNDRNGWLYEEPGPHPPRKAQGVKLAKRRLIQENVICGSQQVQYEA